MPEALTQKQTTGEFSVWWQDPHGTNHCELDHCGAEEAVKMAHSLTRRPAALMGIIRDVKITDGDDYCNFHWQHGKGVVFGG